MLDFETNFLRTSKIQTKIQPALFHTWLELVCSNFTKSELHKLGRVSVSLAFSLPKKEKKLFHIFAPGNLFFLHLDLGGSWESDEAFDAARPFDSYVQTVTRFMLLILLHRFPSNIPICMRAHPLEVTLKWSAGVRECQIFVKFNIEFGLFFLSFFFACRFFFEAVLELCLSHWRWRGPTKGKKRLLGVRQELSSHLEKLRPRLFISSPLCCVSRLLAVSLLPEMRYLWKTVNISIHSMLAEYALAHVSVVSAFFMAACKDSSSSLWMLASVNLWGSISK